MTEEREKLYAESVTLTIRNHGKDWLPAELRHVTDPREIARGIERVRRERA